MEEKQEKTYLHILIDTLRRKEEILRRLTEYTKKQESLLAAGDFDFDAFEEQMKKKDTLIEKLQKLDDGFMDLYARVADEIKTSPKQYETEIRQAQTLIRSITDLSTGLQALEERNRTRLEMLLGQGKQRVRDFKVSSKTAAAYYKNMTGKHQDGDSYFIDKKQ